MAASWAIRVHNCCPGIEPIFCATMRKKTSVLLSGAAGTTTLTDFAG
jgi:hypothetical protein